MAISLWAGPGSDLTIQALGLGLLLTWPSLGVDHRGTWDGGTTSHSSAFSLGSLVVSSSGYIRLQHLLTSICLLESSPVLQLLNHSLLAAPPPVSATVLGRRLVPF